MHRDSRFKMPHDAFYGMHRDGPYAEETKNMIYAERIKIFTHLLKTLTPPRKSIFGHAFPVICREAPVLSLHGKIIRRRSGLLIHVIQSGFNPGIATVTRNANGNVSLQYNSILVCIFYCFPQLEMKVVLYEINRSNV